MSGHEPSVLCCPSCRDEFQAWVMACPDCGVGTVTSLPPAEVDSESEPVDLD